MIPRGPELPLGCDSIILDRLADDLSTRLRMPRAPLIPFGVHTSRDPEGPGSAGLTRKTLHRLMNELIAGWETEAKVRAVFILTTHAADAHLEALSTIRATGQVTLIDIYAASLPDGLATGSVDADLLEAVAPECIDRTLAPVSDDRAARGRAIYDLVLDNAMRRIQASG